MAAATSAVLVIILSACGGKDEAAIEASVSATVEAIAASSSEPTPTAEAPTPVPEPTVDPSVLLAADISEGEALVVAFLAERKVRSYLEEDFERISELLASRIENPRWGWDEERITDQYRMRWSQRKPLWQLSMMTARTLS